MAIVLDGNNLTTSGLINSLTVRGASSTYQDFTIPNGVTSFKVAFSGVSASGTSGWKLQIGPSGGVETTGYVGGSGYQSTAVSSVSKTDCVFINTLTTNVFSGIVTFMHLGNNSWVASGCLGGASSNSIYTGSAKTLTGVLGQLRIGTFNGSDTFSTGSFGIIYQ